MLLVVAPPAPGSVTATRQAAPPPVVEEAGSPGVGPDDDGARYITLPIMGYVMRIQFPSQPLEGRTVRLVGFLTPGTAAAGTSAAS